MAYQLDIANLELAFGGAAPGKPSRRFLLQPAGMLTIAQGRIAASDPLVQPDTPPFTEPVPNGSFPVTLAIAALDGGDERIAYARVDFSPARAVRWEMALIEGQDAAELDDEEDFFGYGVDAGTGCFMGAAAARDLGLAMDSEDDYFESIIAGMDQTYRHTRSWYARKPDPAGAENIVCFSSRYGDGAYPSFFGFDADGKLAALVTDFLILHD